MKKGNESNVKECNILVIKILKRASEKDFFTPIFPIGLFSYRFSIITAKRKKKNKKNIEGQGGALRARVTPPPRGFRVWKFPQYPQK